MRNTTGTGWYQVSDASRAEDFGEQLSPVDLIELESLRTTSNCPPNTTLFVEQESPDTVFFLLTGRVKLSMNSSAGRRVILGIAFPGETLGLAYVVTGSRYEITAETVSPCMIASVERERYLRFLTRHPVCLRQCCTRTLPGVCPGLQEGATTRAGGDGVGKARPFPRGPVRRGPGDRVRRSFILLAHARRDRRVYRRHSRDSHSPFQ